MTRTDTVTLRLGENQKWALTAAAKLRGESLSSFILGAAIDQAIEGVERSATPGSDTSILARKRRKKRLSRVAEFRTPFMQRRYAVGFEKVVHHAAKGMRTDEHSIGILMTYIAEGIGDVMAAGGVVRWPGLLVAAPYRTERGLREFCVPRIQANPPLRNLVEGSCLPEHGRNRELDAHRRRRRPDRCGSLAKVLHDMRQGIIRQDKNICDELELGWRGSSSLHFP